MDKFNNITLLQSSIPTLLKRICRCTVQTPMDLASLSVSLPIDVSTWQIWSKSKPQQVSPELGIRSSFSCFPEGSRSRSSLTFDPVGCFFCHLFTCVWFRLSADDSGRLSGAAGHNKNSGHHPSYEFPVFSREVCQPRLRAPGPAHGIDSAQSSAARIRFALLPQTEAC